MLNEKFKSLIPLQLKDWPIESWPPIINQNFNKILYSIDALAIGVIDDKFENKLLFITVDYDHILLSLTTIEKIEALDQNLISLREVVCSDKMWLIYIEDEKVPLIFSVTEFNIPDNFLPTIGTLLHYKG